MHGISMPAGKRLALVIFIGATCLCVPIVLYYRSRNHTNVLPPFPKTQIVESPSNGQAQSPEPNGAQNWQAKKLKEIDDQILWNKKGLHNVGRELGASSDPKRAEALKSAISKYEVELEDLKMQRSEILKSTQAK
jgi:hypothetical protein